MTNLTFNGVGLYLMVCKPSRIPHFVFQPLTLACTFGGLFLWLREVLSVTLAGWFTRPKGRQRFKSFTAAILGIFDVSERGDESDG